MRAEYYADLCRQYATYLRSYDAGLVPYKIASGANVDDYHWTRTVVERAGQCIDAVSLHYYTVPGPDWQHKGSATDFDRDAYYTTLHKTLRMEELVENHSRIIRRFAKGRPIGLCVDEWGTWYDVEPGTNPGFLYQQNTMRDALVAAVNLNIFNNHCDTVVMANIAQLVNVLQAMLLTEGDKVVLTPTSHVFAMYSGHQGARQLESYAETRMLRRDEEQVPELHVSASEQSDGTVLVTAANLNDTEPVTPAASMPPASRPGSWPVRRSTTTPLTAPRLSVRRRLPSRRPKPASRPCCRPAVWRRSRSARNNLFAFLDGTAIIQSNRPAAASCPGREGRYHPCVL